ncbi:MAG: BNR-4 repeat-containing protein [Phycisphaerae bacterium]
MSKLLHAAAFFAAVAATGLNAAAQTTPAPATPAPATPSPNTPSPATPSPTTVELAPSGAWNWYGNPRGIYHNGKIVTGHVTNTGLIQTVTLDLNSHATTATTLLTPASLGGEVDDHNPPSFFETSDGRLTAFIAGHNEPDLFYRVASTPGDATNWGAVNTIGTNVGGGTKGHTYPQAFALPGETDKVFLSWRGANWNPTYSVGTYNPADQTWAWTPAANYIADPANSSSVRPYTLIHGNGQKIGMVFNDNHPRDASNNLYYAQIARDADGDLAYQRADGSVIRKVSTGPLDLTEAEIVFDRTAAPTTAGDNSWGWDIAFDENANPVLTYASFVPDPAQPNKQSLDTHQYHYARWNGTSWQDTTLVTDAGGTIADLTVGNRGEFHYSGGIALDPSDPDTVYLSRVIDGQFEIEQWITADAGLTWNVITLTDNPADEDVRPFVPLGLPDDLQAVIWMSGQYDYWEPVAGSGGLGAWDTSVQAWINVVPEPASAAVVALAAVGLVRRPLQGRGRNA